MQENPEPRKFQILGAQISHIVERTYDGTLDDIGWEESVSELRSNFHSNGTVQEVGLSKEWIGGNDFRRVHFYLTSRAGKTRVKFIVVQKDSLFVTWLLGIFVAALISLALGNYLSAHLMNALPGYLAGCLGTAFAITRGLAYWSANNRRIAENVLKRIEEISSETSNANKVDLRQTYAHEEAIGLVAHQNATN